MMIRNIIEEIKWILSLLYSLLLTSMIMIFIAAFTVIPWGLGVAEMWQMLFG